MRFKGKLAVVTGAARGIGLSCATRLAQDGAKVILLDIEDETGKKSTAEIGRTGEAHYVRCDVDQKAEVDRTFDEIFARHGNVDIPVNDAGIVRRADFLEPSEKDFDDVIRTNLKSVLLCGQKAARQMVSKGLKGAIVNMSSTSVIMTMPTISPYAASKGGISSLTRAMSLSLAPHGIRVNAVGPGTVVTELNRDALLSDPVTRHSILSRTPIGRLGEGADVASVVAFLASDDAGYVTGQTLYIDGGRAGLNYTMTPKAS
jgi:glucose 1-dehydrogenase